MTQAKLAEMLDLSQGAIASWVNGSHSPRNVKQFRALETALKLPAGILTAPDTIREDPTSYMQTGTDQQRDQHAIDVDAVEKALDAMISVYGLDYMKNKGAAWSAKTIIMLYDLLTQTATSGLTTEQIEKILKVTEKHKNR